MYRRIGILSFSSPGHFYPLTALGRRLQSRGHDVVYFQVADLESPIRAAGLRFRQIGQHDFPLGSLRARRGMRQARWTRRAALRDSRNRDEVADDFAGRAGRDPR